MTNFSALTDEQLVRAYAKGNNEAFDTLLRRHQDRIFSYILRIIKNEDIANDIFQETFVKAIQTIRLGRYTENGKFPAWISRIAHNLIIDYYRQEKSENLQSADLTDVDILNRKELCEDTIEDIMISNQIRNERGANDAVLPEPKFQGNSGNHGSKHQYCPRKNALCHTQSPTHSPRKRHNSHNVTEIHRETITETPIQESARIHRQGAFLYIPQ